MWRGDDGRFHTVALPDPGEVFTDAAVTAIERVPAQANSNDIAELMERRELAVVEYWDDRPVDEEAEAPFVDSTPPIGLFDRVVGSLSELETARLKSTPAGDWTSLQRLMTSSKRTERELRPVPEAAFRDGWKASSAVIEKASAGVIVQPSCPAP